ncbi:MAG: NFACT family protein [Acidobacteria bacterium]|nr:NFACT family protein [Acidobacteriota bacterium]
MDALTLDRLLAELRPALCGRHLGRPRGVGPHAVAFEISGSRDRRLWLDVSRGTAGLYLLSRDEVRALEDTDEESWPGRTRQAILLLRKHVGGTRIREVLRVPGERALLVEAGDVRLSLRISGPAPALTLAVAEVPVATLGDGPPAWPPRPPAPEREWDRVDPEAVAAAAAAATAKGHTRRRAVLSACPSFGPLLAGLVGESPASVSALRARLATPRPTVLLPGPLQDCHDADLADGPADLGPIPIEGRVAHHPPSWTEAAATFLCLRRRGELFGRARRTALESARREIRRLVRLEAHLGRDVAGLADAAALRRQGEAILASLAVLAPGVPEAELRDPYEPSRRVKIFLDPRLSAPANADRLFERARRVDRARARIADRLDETRRALEAAHAHERRALEARDLPALRSGESRGRRSARPGASAGGGRLRYLTSRGLPVLVGRGARENHELTFGVARPDDLWLHVRDRPGAHVILRDEEGRAGTDDVREAAEVAAFHSEARGEASVDVHVARRKHVRPARGGPGRVLVGHSDTLRVAPRDPAGRLRRR